MPLYFQKPENALKRANEFIFVGKKQRALDALTDVIKSRKHRSWQKFHEPIMVKFLSLCVDLKKSHVAKEGLFQYRNICQQVNLKSLEDVVKGYLTLAEEKADAARKEAHLELSIIDDLDNLQTPESILLSAVSTEVSQDRNDRVVLVPWVKFLWESYRHCLELLRNNFRVERLYHDIAQQGFKFCLKYERKTEFKKMCDLLRAHLSKHQSQQSSVNLNNPESQAFNMETRLIQLDYAILMELWQEAFKAIEDIHGLMALSKKAPKAQLMALYYHKMALVFWKAGNYLYHAAALFRLFHFLRDMKRNITMDELQKISIKVIVATLSVPPPNQSDVCRLVETDDKVVERNQRLLARLLGLDSLPTRAALVRDLIRFGVVNLAPPFIQELYRWLEIEFRPIHLCARVAACLAQMVEESADLRQYEPLVQDMALFRFLKLISQVYTTIDFGHILQMAHFTQLDYLEKVVVESVQKHGLPIRIDYRKRCLRFSPGLTFGHPDSMVAPPRLEMGQTILSQLNRIQGTLSKCLSTTHPGLFTSASKKLKTDLIVEYDVHKSENRKNLLSRHHIIEERKELLENLSYIKEEEERKLTEAKQQKLKHAEMERMARETEERTKQRIIQEKTAMKKKIVLEKIEQLKKSEIGARLFGSLEQEELENLDPEEILNRQVEQIDREKRELHSKLLMQSRKIDYIERAKRIEEVTFLKDQYEEYKIEDIHIWEELQREKIDLLHQEREISLQNKNRVIRMVEDKNAFVQAIKARRQLEYQKELEVFNQLLVEKRKERLKERAEKRKEERKKIWIENREKEMLKLEVEKLAEELLKQKEQVVEIKKRPIEKPEEQQSLRGEAQSKSGSSKYREEVVSKTEAFQSWRDKREDSHEWDDGTDNYRRSDDNRRTEIRKEETSWRKSDTEHKTQPLPRTFFDRKKSETDDWRTGDSDREANKRGGTHEKIGDHYRPGYNKPGDSRYESKTDLAKKRTHDNKNEADAKECDKQPPRIRILRSNSIRSIESKESMSDEKSKGVGNDSNTRSRETSRYRASDRAQDSHRDKYRPPENARGYDRSNRDSDRSNRDNDRSNRDNDRSNRDGDRSSRDNDRSNRDSDRSNRDNDRSNRDSDRSNRDNDRSTRDSGRSSRDSDRKDPRYKSFEKAPASGDIKKILVRNQEGDRFRKPDSKVERNREESQHWRQRDPPNPPEDEDKSWTKVKGKFEKNSS